MRANVFAAGINGNQHEYIIMKKIFFAYSDNAEDVDLYKKFNKHFAAYARKGLIDIVDKDELFRINNDGSKTVEFLTTADLTVPLLSIDYLNSDECVKLLNAATNAKKLIIPVLLRDFDWQEMEEIRILQNSLLPEDKQSVNTHVSVDKDKDEVFASIAKRVKGIVFNDFVDISIKKRSGTFYYIIGSIVMLIGILAGIVSYTRWDDWKISTIIFLMFAGIALFAVKNVLFPTKFNIN
jgi:hypothetical protein